MTGSRNHQHDDGGAAAVEFALLLPLFAMLVIGLISSGFAFEAWLGVTQGAQDSSRFAATLSIQAGGGSSDTWLATVGQRAFDASNLGTTASAVPGSIVCVALFTPSNKFPAPVTPVRRAVFTTDGAGTVSAVYSSGTACPGIPAPGSGAEYVQVSVSTPESFNFVLGSAIITVHGSSANRYEAVALS